MSDTSVRSDLLTALRERVVAGGAMRTMMQAHDLALEDFQGHEGCNEILDITRPVVVRLMPDAAFAVGGDVAETNTLGSNWASRAGDDIVDRIRETALAGGWIARVPAERLDAPGRTPSRSWGAWVSTGNALADYCSWLDEGVRGSEEPSYERLVEAEALRPAK